MLISFLPSLGAVYVCTEDAFPSKRWQQLATAFVSKHRKLGFTVDQLSNNLYVEHAATIVSHETCSTCFTRSS